MTDWGDNGLAGGWIVEGTTPDGDLYSGQLELEPIGNVYVATWRSAEIGVQHGTGLVCGGALLVSRAPTSSEDTRAAVVSYFLSSRGHLQAYWNSTEIGGTVATGRGIGGQPVRLEGERLITYWDNRGRAYPPLTLRIAPMGGAYRLRWEDPQSGTLRFEGVGLGFDDGLTAAWSRAGEHPQLDILVFRPTDAGMAEASWASADHVNLGRETIRRP